MEDLCNELLLELFDEFNLLELLNLADVNYRFRDLITQYHKYHLNEKSVGILRTEVMMGAITINPIVPLAFANHK